MTDEENLDGEKTGFFSRLKKSLLKTRDNLAGGIDNVVRGTAKVGPELMLELEEVLLMADVGMPATTKIIAELKAQVKDSRIRSNDEV
ncbi:MAG: signal recognition particle receptor subunit alpha, partial [Proteobacteria bacterium]|nr:signal recognition particle receptor subunit alpha [Pseudomonadota bacterium]